MQNPPGMLQAFDVAFDLGAGETGSKRAVRVAPQYDTTIRTLVHYKGAGIGTIHGTGGYRRGHLSINCYVFWDLSLLWVSDSWFHVFRQRRISAAVIRRISQFDRKRNSEKANIEHRTSNIE
jgi:hypothetical protein